MLLARITDRPSWTAEKDYLATSELGTGRYLRKHPVLLLKR